MRSKMKSESIDQERSDVLSDRKAEWRTKGGELFVKSGVVELDIESEDASNGPLRVRRSDADALDLLDALGDGPISARDEPRLAALAFRSLEEEEQERRDEQV